MPAMAGQAPSETDKFIETVAPKVRKISRFHVHVVDDESIRTAVKPMEIPLEQVTNEQPLYHSQHDETVFQD